MRCEQAIHKKTHSETEIRRRWLQVLNRRLTEDKITATKGKKDIAHMRKTKSTWEPVLRKTGDQMDG
jgi:hypothetical protein